MLRGFFFINFYIISAKWITTRNHIFFGFSFSFPILSLQFVLIFDIYIFSANMSEYIVVEYPFNSLHFHQNFYIICKPDTHIHRHFMFDLIWWFGICFFLHWSKKKNKIKYWFIQCASNMLLFPIQFQKRHIQRCSGRNA